MENIRNRFREDRQLYPDLATVKKPPSSTASIISVGSTESSHSAARIQRQPKGIVIISSDEEGKNDIPPVRQEANAARNGRAATYPLKHRSDSNAQPGAAHTNALKSAMHPGLELPDSTALESPHPMSANGDDGEEMVDMSVPDFQDENRFLSPADAEKALRELMGGGINQDVHKEIDEEDTIVPGFQEDVRLLPHQVIGRTWMRDREDTTKKKMGGILADDMGLGKTIQALCRIVEGRPKKSDKADGWDAPTLVICPLALLGQWASEIRKIAVNIKVIEHHGSNRTTDPELLKKAVVVITTYDVVLNEHASYASTAKDESKVFKAKKKSRRDSSNEDSDDAEHFGRTLAVKKRPATRKNPLRDVLFRLRWWRIILDEAHNIKNRNTKSAQACCALEGKFRWCLTGTPMQNDVSELFSLMKFLRIRPLSDWTTFNEQIAKPVKSGKDAIRAMKRLQVVLKQIMLRRKKTDTLNGKALIELPARNVEIVSCEFDASERAFYVALENKMDDVMQKLMAEKGSNYISVLLLLLRLRQACLHPVLVSSDYKADVEAVEPKAAKKGDEDSMDPDDLIAAFGQLGVTRKCQLCQSELNSKNTEDEATVHCIDCAPLAIQARQQEERPDSAKIRMILKLLNDIDERSDKQEKTIIFSQFTSMLDLIQPFLEERGIKYVRYDGKMKKEDREWSLEKIKTSSRTRCILISFKAGSTGLNLTACNNVILVDLWWNPALEDQAFDRAHRFGQTRDVNIFKLKIDETVEDRILLLQEKKRALAMAALSGDKLKNMRLGLDDLLALFRPGGRDDDEDD